MRRFVFVLAWAFAASVAQRTPLEAGEILKGATGEILVQVRLLDLKPLAEALRIARVERGVKVYLLTTDRGLVHPESYGPGLALAGVAVRFLPSIGEEFFVVDRRVGLVLKRDYVGAQLEEAKPEPLVERFYRAFLQAVPFSAEDWAYRLFQREYMRRGGP